MCALKCLAQVHNALTRPGLKPGPLDAESSALTIRLLRSEIQIKTSRFLVTQVFPRLREFVFLLLCGPIGSLCLFVFLFSSVRLAAVITMVFLFRHSTKISSITTDKLIFRGRLQLKPL